MIFNRLFEWLKRHDQKHKRWVQQQREEMKKRTDRWTSDE